MNQLGSIKINYKDNIAIIELDTVNAGVNVLNQNLLNEIGLAIEEIKSKQNSLKAMVLTSAKNDFILGADVTEFKPMFAKGDDYLSAWIKKTNQLFNQIEDLNLPTVAAINGMALGGGFEITLACDYRLATPKAKLGLPETKLGIIPGWGGTVRLPRLCGADHAIEWITSGKHYSALEVLKIGAVDGVIETGDLVEAAIKWVKRIHEQKIDYLARRDQKKSELKLRPNEAAMIFNTAKGFVLGMTKGQYPAPIAAIDLMEKTKEMKRDEALAMELATFVTLSKTPQADSLIQVFLSDQLLKKVSKKIAAAVSPIESASVLGAGIMGGGIAYQSASKGVPVVMKDITPAQLDLGMNEASKLLIKLVERNKMDHAGMCKVISNITPTLEYHQVAKTKMIVEAVVENVKVKQQVLGELEKMVTSDTVICSNTSTISINKLASELKRPENFCGMHFFNPVHMMPLVEVIRGEKTSEETIAKTVQYALQMGKTPIVVNDCAGFLVNRVLFPYFNGFIKLVQDGVDFKKIDKVMEKFGWPMGPAYLLDVVGIDTAYHCIDIMAEAFPDRMSHDGATILTGMYENKRFGQKNKLGFYEYEMDKKGKPKKVFKESVYGVIKPFQKNSIEVTDQQIIDRMMLPMVFECIRCLDEKIVNTPTEVDMGLMLGLGFPPFRAGALKYADVEGITTIVERSKAYHALGKMYEAPTSLVEMSKNNQKFYN